MATSTAKPGVVLTTGMARATPIRWIPVNMARRARPGARKPAATKAMMRHVNICETGAVAAASRHTSTVVTATEMIAAASGDA